MELGVPARILQVQDGFTLHHEVIWNGSDVDYVVPMVETAQAQFPDQHAVSCDRAFHSPTNRICFDERLDDNFLPKKGYLSKAERNREQGMNWLNSRIWWATANFRCIRQPNQGVTDDGPQ